MNIIKLNIHEARENITEEEKKAIELLGGSIEVRDIKHRISVGYDYDCPFTNDYLKEHYEGVENVPTFYSNLARYKLHPNEERIDSLPFFNADEHSYKDIPQLAKKAGANIVPIYAYIHSNIALSINRGGQFACQWDSGLAGFALYPTEPKQQDLDILEGYAELYNNIAIGSICSVLIADEFDNEIESISGIVGFDSLQIEALALAKAYDIPEADVKYALEHIK